MGVLPALCPTPGSLSWRVSPAVPLCPWLWRGPSSPLESPGIPLHPHPSPLVLWMAFSSFLSFSREGSCHPGLGAPLLREARGPVSSPSRPTHPSSGFSLRVCECESMFLSQSYSVSCISSPEFPHIFLSVNGSLHIVQSY